jgi:uncharacterized protein (DUF433 family)
MRHTIDLSERGEAELRRLVRETGQSESYVLAALSETLLQHFYLSSSGEDDLQVQIGGRWYAIEVKRSAPTIRSDKTILGGDARIRETRIPVWLLVTHKEWGETDSEILAQYPSLNAADLIAAWDYYAANAERVIAERRAQEAA